MKTKLVHGIYLPESDTHFSKHLEKGELFEGKGTYQYGKIKRALDLCQKYKPGMRVALDIGAHVGLWSRVLASHFDKVIAFEAHPDLAEIWRMNMADDMTAVLHNYALSDGYDKLKIQYTADNSGNAHIADGGLEVQSFPLDEVFKDCEPIDFIKIDVEGFEKFVIMGGGMLINRAKPVMVVEQKPGNGSRYGLSDTAAIDLLVSWGARVDSVKAGDYFMVWDD